MGSDEAILLVSGGLDSWVAWHYLGKPKALYIDLGHRYAMFERHALAVIFRDHPANLMKETLYFLKPYEQEDAFIPGRNLLLASIAAYEGDRIYLALQRGELSLYDRSEAFCASVSELLTKLHGKPKVVDSPFWTMTKVEMVGWYLEQRLPVANLLATWSCYNPDENISPARGHCGACPACFRRWVALQYYGLSEVWHEKLPQWSGLRTYIDKLKAGEYDVQRTTETFEVLKKYSLI